MNETDFRFYKGSYIIYETGEIFSIKGKKFITPYENAKGYFSFSPNGDSKMVHRAVLEAFEGGEASEIDHIDGNKKNNALYNLEYVTRSENMRRAWKNGVRNRKESFKEKPVTWNGKVFKSGRALSEYLGLSKGACSVAITNHTKIKGHYPRLLSKGEIK